MSFRVSDLVAQGIIQGDSAYANIFYDSANTAFYLDPAGTSILNGLTVGGSSVVTNNGGTWNINISGSANTLDGLDSADFMRNYGMLNNTDVYVNFRVMRNSNSSSANDGMYIGYGNTGGGLTRIFGGGATTGELIKYSNYTYEPGSFRAPIFYDSENTAYYVDPAGTSNIYQLRAGAGNASPYSTTFSHTLAGVGGSSRVVNFDGNGTTPSVWWSNGGTAIGAIDAISGGGLSFWSNNGSSWQQQISMTYGTVNVLTTLQQGGNQVLHAGNYNSYSPTLTGGGASGTWGINISGNAATATNSSQLQGLTIDQIFNNRGRAHGDPQDFNLVSVFGPYFIQGTTNGPGTGSSQFYGISLGLGDGYAYSQYVMQMAIPRYNSSDKYLTYRTREAGSWGSWVKVSAGYSDSAGNADTVDGYHLDQDVRTSGAPSFQYIGVNPSGASNNGYGISLYGGAGAGPTYGIFFQGTGTYGTHGSVTGDWATYFTMNNDNARGWIWRKVGGGNVASLSAGGILQVDGSMRAPIFYDSQDTSYYLDPAADLSFRTSGYIGSYRNDTQGIIQTHNTSAGSPVQLSLRHSYGDVIMQNYRGWIYLYGGAIQTDNSFRAPIFYDSDNTGYYVDPASTSNLVAITTGATGVYNTFQTWTNLNGFHGFYSAVHNGAHFYPNPGSYGSWMMSGSRNGYQGIEFNSGSNGAVSVMINTSSSTSGFHNNSYGWQIKWENGTLRVGKNTYGGGTEAVVLDASNYTSYAPTLTGGGASGTWGINITGQSSTTNVVNAARYVNNDFNTLGNLGNGFRAYSNYIPSGGSYNQPPNGAGDYRVYQISSPESAGNWGGQLVQNFYTDQMWFRRQQGSSWQAWRELIHDGNYTTWTIARGGDTVDGIIYYRTNLGAYSGSLSGARLQVYNDNNQSAFMSFHRSGQYAVNFGLDQDNIMRIGGWSASANRWELDMSGNNTVAGSFRAPIFYDSQNTYYYIDPNSTSRIATLVTEGQIYINNGDPTIFLQDSSHRSAMLHCNSNEFYVLRGSGTNSTSWATFNGYWPLVINLENNDATFGRNISAPVGTITAGNDMRAPIFYDSNDTTYYLDPNTTGTSLNVAGNITMGVGRGDSSIIMGDNDQGNRTIHCNSDRIGFLTQGGNWGAYLDDNNIWYAEGSMRAPIFFDSQNTNFYLDPASTSVLNGLNVGGSPVLTTGNWTSTIGPNPLGFYGATPYIWTGSQVLYYWTRIANINNVGDSQFTIEISGKNDVNYVPYVLAVASISAWNNSTQSIKLDCISSYDRNIRIAVDNSGNVWLYGQFEWSSYLRWRIIEIFGSPTIYTSGFTQQTTQPANSVVIEPGQQVRGNQGSMSSASVGLNQNRVGGLDSIGDIYAPKLYDRDNVAYYIDLNSNTSLRTYGSWRADSSPWDGDYSGKIQYHANHWYVQGADLFIYRNGGGANVFTINQGGTVTASADMRAPIFYDSNDTTYYADFASNGTSIFTAGAIRSSGMIMLGSSGGGQIYPTMANGGVSVYGGSSLTNGAWITVTGISYGSSPGAGSAEIIVRSESSSKLAMFSFNGSTYTGRAALWGSNGNFVIGSATVDYGYKLYVDGTIYATGNVIAYSDESVKTNVREIENPLDRVLNTRGVMYDRTDNEEKDNIGFIAQELEKEFPELVSTGNNGKKGVMYQNMVAVLIEAMKEQNKEIQKLKMLIDGTSR